MEPLTVFDSFPPVLYRVFNDVHWAREFVDHGRMRFSRVEYFADLEDPLRADAAEGKAHRLIDGNVFKARLDENDEIIEVWQEPGVINYRGESLNPAYIICFSLPPDGDERLLPWKFGSVGVRIRDPKRLAQDITDALTREGKLRGTPVVECRSVMYDKGERGDDIADHFERTRLNWFQKPPAFADEYEWRFAVLATPPIGGAPELGMHHNVDLGGPLRYAELFQPPASAA